MGVHDPRKTYKVSGGREPRGCDKIGKHGRRKRGGKGVLVIRKWGEGHPSLQSVVEIFGLVVSGLFEYGHHELELVLGHDDRS